MTQRFLRKPFHYATLALIVGLSHVACGYQFVQHKDSVRTIAVPVFANSTLRRGFERDLTRAIQREVKETLPYLLVNEDDADLILTGEILSIQENVLVEGRNDEVLEGNIQISVSIELKDRLGQPIVIARQSRKDQPKHAAVLQDQAEFVVSRSENRDTATREAIKEIAERIVQTLSGPPL